MMRTSSNGRTTARSYHYVHRRCYGLLLLVWMAAVSVNALDSTTSTTIAASSQHEEQSLGGQINSERRRVKEISSIHGSKIDFMTTSEMNGDPRRTSSRTRGTASLQEVRRTFSMFVFWSFTSRGSLSICFVFTQSFDACCVRLLF